MTRSYRIASVPADGIGPEVIDAGLEVLDAVAARDGGFKLTIDHYDWGSNWYRKHGEFMPADGLAWLRLADLCQPGISSEPWHAEHAERGRDRRLARVELAQPLGGLHAVLLPPGVGQRDVAGLEPRIVGGDDLADGAADHQPAHLDRRRV